MQKVKSARLQTAYPLGKYGSVSLIPRDARDAKNMQMLDNGSMALEIDGIIYVIPSANIALMELDGGLHAQTPQPKK